MAARSTLRAVAQPTFAASARRVAFTRFASTVAPTTDQSEALKVFPMHDPRIKHGSMAFVLPIPEDIPMNDFAKRRKAVEEHAVGEHLACFAATALHFLRAGSLLMPLIMSFS